MRRIIAYGMLTLMLISAIAVISFAVDCDEVNIYHPFYKRNMPMCRVSINDLPALMVSPLLARWTNMDALGEYLSERGVSLKELQDKSKNVNRELLSEITGRKRIVKLSDRGDLGGTMGIYGDAGNRAIRDIDCDADDGEIEFEIVNIGVNDWFLVPQATTEGRGESHTKMYDDINIAAKPIKLFINNFLVNDDLSVNKYWMGKKLFFPLGETFADACNADFLRVNRDADCEFGPIVMRGGLVSNEYALVTPSFTERGTFVCD